MFSVTAVEFGFWYMCLIQLQCCLLQQLQSMAPRLALTTSLSTKMCIWRYPANVQTLSSGAKSYSVAQVLGWDANGTVIFNDVLCKENSAENHGGCFYAVGTGIVNDGAVMLQNSASNGGSIRECNPCRHSRGDS